MDFIFRRSGGSHVSVSAVHPSLLLSSSLSSPGWYHLQSISSYVTWSRLFTWPNHLNRAFLHLSAILSTFSLSLMFSFLTWSLSMWPHAHLHIFISVTSSFFTCELVTGTVSIPYSIAGWTIIMCVFPFTCGGTPVSHRTPDIFLQLFHPHCYICTHVTIALQGAAKIFNFSDLWQVGRLHMNTS